MKAHRAEILLQGKDGSCWQAPHLVREGRPGVQSQPRLHSKNLS